MNDDDETRVRHGSGNVFADLGYAGPDTHFLKAGLMSRVIEIIHARKLTQTQAARLTGVSQPDISRLLKGQFRDVSMERIMRMLTRLGCEVDIVVKPAGGSSPELERHFPFENGPGLARDAEVSAT